MKILFLDDDGYRAGQFMPEFPTATWVTTAEECISELKKGDWDLVCLDHDLGGYQYVDSGRPDTGMEVVRWIEEHKPKIGRIYVHTMNTGAGFTMTQVLERLGYWTRFRPFGSLIEAVKCLPNVCEIDAEL